MSTLQPRRWQQRNQNHFAKYMQFINYFKLARAVQQIEHNIYIHFCAGRKYLFKWMYLTNGKSNSHQRMYKSTVKKKKKIFVKESFVSSYENM